MRAFYGNKFTYIQQREKIRDHNFDMREHERNNPTFPTMAGMQRRTEEKNLMPEREEKSTDTLRAGGEKGRLRREEMYI